MHIGRIQGTTRTIGKSQGYYGLPLRDITLNDTVTGPGTPAMESAWLPTPDELTALAAGAPVILRTYGSGHPPVMLYVGENAGAAEELVGKALRAAYHALRSYEMGNAATDLAKDIADVLAAILSARST